MTPIAVLLVGAGGHAKACIDVIEQHGDYSVAGLVGLPGEVGSRVLGHAVVGSDADLEQLSNRHKNALVAVGQIKTPELRVQLFNSLEKIGYSFPVIVSPNAYVSPHARIGAGTIVMHGAVINAGAIVGRNCIVNSQALIEHDGTIGDHCHIATAAAINSGVQVGTGAFIGSNSSVRQCTQIGDRCVVGMGQRVLKDCTEGTWLPPRRSST